MNRNIKRKRVKLKHGVYITSIVLLLITAISLALGYTNLACATPNSNDEEIDELLKLRESAQMRHENTTSRQPVQHLEQQSQRTAPASQGISEDWMLVLINEENLLSDNYLPNLKSLTNGLMFDERAIDQLNAMLSDMKNQGLSPVVCSAYRSIEDQRALYDNKVSQLMSSGLNQTQAESEAVKSVAYPGASEHNLGLAVDIVSLGYQLLDSQQANTPEVQWLINNCADYGFILRYPKEKEEITGVVYEPWHFRYVGITAAREMVESNLCLEEYLSR